MGHVVSENRHGLIMGVAMTAATGNAETDAALEMTDRFQQRHGHPPTTMGSDKGYDDGSYYRALEERKIIPHGAMTSIEPQPETASKKRRVNAEARQRMRERQSTIGYELSQRCRKKVEECFGWMKCIGGVGRSRHVGRWKIKQQFEMAAATFNLVRLRRLLPTN